MTAIYRHRTVITNIAGMPGVATMYAYDVNTFVASVRAFWDAIKVYIPSGTTYSLDAFGDVLDDTDGTITGSWTATPVAAVVGTGGGVYAAPAGCQVRWNTAVVRDGRRLRGRTFIVPLVSGAYQSDGTLLGTFVTALQTASDALIASQNATFCIWHRPREARAADGSVPAVTYRAGSSALVTAAAVPDKVAILRSRRD